jgi:hypothetical protein
MQRKQQVGECWVCVIFFACVCVWVRQIRRLRLTIPSRAAAARRSRLAWTISWLGFGLFDQLLLVCYSWGKVRYPLFGYLA